MTELVLSQQNTRPPTGAPCVAVRGTAITTGASAATGAIKDTLAGTPPNRVRLAATAACYARLGTPAEGTAAIAAAGTGYVEGEVVTLAGGTFTTAMEVTAATLQLISASVNAIGTGYAKDDTITLAGGTFSAAGVATVATTQLASAALNAAGTGYVPADTITLAGGTFTTAAVLTVATTKVVSATVAAGGAGDLGDGAGVIVEGTTGTGTKFRASVTIAGNAIASVQSITVAGSYTVNPTAIANEPVTYISGAASGTELTGAQLNVVMGVDTFTITTRGNYTVETAAFTQGATSGSGVDATFNTGLYGVRTVTISTPGVYTVTSAALTQTSTTGSGTGATFNSASFGLLTVTVSEPGAYTVEPSNPVSQGSTTGSGVDATFTVTWATAAAAGDMLVYPGEAMVVDAVGFDHVSAIQVSGAGVLVVTPLEN